MSAEEFYIGYLERSPAGIAGHTRRYVVLALLLVGACGAIVALGHRRLAAAAFEFGVERSFEGTLRAEPAPVLEVARPGALGGLPAVSIYGLVGPGKHGASDLVSAYDGRPARLRGTLIYRDAQTLIELVPESLELLEGEGLRPEQGLSLGQHTLVGEIVDSKCFLGVMNPGDLKTHRACAAHCISGGIPPVLCVRDENGRAAYFLLVSSTGGSVHEEVLDLVAEPVEITGEVVRYGDRMVLRADPETYRRRS